MSTKPKFSGLPPRHPLSAIFPDHGGDPLNFLVQSIKEHGQRHPIMLYQGMILDGWRRGMACYKAGIEPKFEEFVGTPAEAAVYVWIENYHRRHLGPGELPLVAARYANYLKDHPNGEEDIGSVASKFGTSRTSIDKARKVIDRAEPEVIEAVEKGIITVSDAAKIADEKPKVQRSAVEKVVERHEKTAAKAAAKDKESRNGQPVFDDKSITTPFGQMYRACVARWQHMGSKEDPKFTAIKEAIDELHEAMRVWGVN